jgi:hypothetical protein
MDQPIFRTAALARVNIPILRINMDIETAVKKGETCLIMGVSLNAGIYFVKTTRSASRESFMVSKNPYPQPTLSGFGLSALGFNPGRRVERATAPGPESPTKPRAKSGTSHSVCTPHIPSGSPIKFFFVQQPGDNDQD